MDESEKQEPTLDSVALAEAVLCAQCEIISNSGGEQCEICGSRSLMSVSRVLGGCIVGDRAVLLDSDSRGFRNGFTVLVNPDAANLLQRLRRRRNGGT
jgi:hypothetical protein